MSQSEMPAGAPAHTGEHATQLHLPHGSWWPFWLANAIALLVIGMILLGRSTKDGSMVPFPVGLGFTLLGVGALVASLLGWFVQDFKWWNERLGTGEHIPKVG